MESLVQDLRYGLRGLRTSPLFTLVAVITLALGIGATSTLFTVIDAVLIRPLPFPAPDQIVSMSELNRGHDLTVASSDNIAAWRSARSLAAVAAYGPASTALTGVGDPLQLSGTRVTPNLFSVLGVRPILGRALVETDAAPGAPDVVLLGRTLWRDRFSGDTTVIGRSVDLDGKPAVVVGVMNDLDEFPTAGSFWVPLRINPSGDGPVFYYRALGRMRPGVTVDVARRELVGITRTLDARRPAAQRGGDVVVMNLHDRMIGSVRQPLLMLFGAVTFLLLVSCANVANLLLARAATRRREVAVRLALGAGWWRLARQIVTESVLLSLAGAALGMLLPIWAVGMLVRLSPDNIPRLAHAHADLRVAGFAAALAIATGLLFGAVPAWMATRGDALGALKDSAARSTGSIHQQHVRRVLVAAELATALLLLTGAGLLTRSFLDVLAVDPGYRADHLLGTTLHLPSDRYPTSSGRSAFFEVLLSRVRALPGVQDVGLTAVLPSGGFSMMTTMSALTMTADSTPVTLIGTSRGYPHAIGLGLVAGRLFNSSDAAGSAPAVLLSAAAARAIFPHGDAVGQLLPASRITGPVAARVVGVVKNVPQMGVDVTPLPQVYLLTDPDNLSVVVLRAAGDVARLEPMIRHIVSTIDPLQPVASFTLGDEALTSALAPRRLNFMVVDLFAGLALLLAAVGLYGVTAFQVTQRTREMGIRMALGATGGSVRGLIMRQGMLTVVLGCAVGLALSVALSRVLAGLLYGVGTRDAATFVVAPLMLIVVGALASYLPARRATAVDPVVALRNE